MWLQNLKVRVKEYPKGWSVEVQKEKRYLLFFKQKYWVHIESVSGIRDKPWYYKNKETAIYEAIKHFEWDLIINTEYMEQWTSPDAGSLRISNPETLKKWINKGWHLDLINQGYIFAIYCGRFRKNFCNCSACRSKRKDKSLIIEVLESAGLK